MFVQTLIMAAIAVILVLIGYFKGQNQHIVGIKSAMDMTIEILPMLLFAFVVAGMVGVLMPHHIISKWIGAESGMRGIFIGTLAGTLSPGGPYINLPIVAALLRSGASIGATVAFLTSWLILSLSRLPLEVGMLGWRFTLMRLASTFFFPPLAGFIAQAIFGGAK